MNEIIVQKIYNFIECVNYYLELEYDSIYHEILTESTDDFFDFIGSYYMGGCSIPDTARYVVELILSRKSR